MNDVHNLPDDLRALQVESPYGSGEFYRELEEAFEDVPNLALSEIRNKDGIFESIKEFLGRGR